MAVTPTPSCDSLDEPMALPYAEVIAQDRIERWEKGERIASTGLATGDEYKLAKAYLALKGEGKTMTSDELADYRGQSDDKHDEQKILCHAPGDRCHGCDHYKGKAPVCSFAPSAGGASGFADWLRSHPFEPRRPGARIYTLDDLMAAWQAARSIPSHELGSAHIDRWEVNIINRPGDYAYLKHRKSQTGQWVTFDDHLRAMQSHVGDSEGHPGIAHDLETFRTALITIRDECFNGHAYDIAERALNDATDSTVKEKP
jgi:hypothetical protein